MMLYCWLHTTERVESETISRTFSPQTLLVAVVAVAAVAAAVAVAAVAAG